jgi:hypothetical protein
MAFFWRWTERLRRVRGGDGSAGTLPIVAGSAIVLISEVSVCFRRNTTSDALSSTEGRINPDLYAPIKTKAIV